MKKQLSILWLALCLSIMPLLETGCRTSTGRYDAPTSTYQPGEPADPVVVSAQQVRAQALDTFDLLWTTEKYFRAELWKLSPDIKRTADYTRKNSKQWLDDLTEQIRVYQLNRTEANKLKLEGIIQILRTAVGQSQVYISQAKALQKP